MAFKEEIKEKLPAYLTRTPEFRVFNSLLDKENIQSSASLRAYLDARMKKLRADLNDKSKANREGSMNRQLRPIAKEMDFLKFVRQKFMRYL